MLVDNKFVMRIIDNKKDYYDYLAGVIGIDEYITYDRRNSFRLNNQSKSTYLSDRFPKYPFYFCPWKNGVYKFSDATLLAQCGGEHWDIPWEKDDRKSWWSNRGWYNIQNKDSREGNYNISYRELYLLVGNVLYIFKVRRILAKESDDIVTIDPTLVCVIRDIDRSKMNTTAPIVISSGIKGTAYTDFYIRRSELEKMSPEERYRGAYIPSDNNGKYAENPILADTWIPSLIPAEEIWNNISDYLLSIKEPKIVDNRTDIEHLEAHGFDKKNSFRNVK